MMLTEDTVTEDRFSKLYRSYRGMVWSLVRNILQDDNLAEDVTQETFWRMHQMDDIEHPYSWLRKVAQHLALNWVRDAKRRAEIIQANPNSIELRHPDSILDVLIAEDLKSILAEEILEWPEEFHETAQRLIAGNRPHEIQEQLNLTLGTTSSRIHRIRKRFKTFLED
jgi:RNA polymerase sigma-70 factor (ECF subfamily)